MTVTRVFKGVAIAAAAIMLGLWMGRINSVEAQSGRVFEMRTYTANEGKLDALEARFRNHTTRIFEKHGMTNIGYWKPADAPLSQNTLIYILAHHSREAAKKSWDAFRADPEWQKAQKESEVNGRLVAKVESVFMTAADYSKIK